MTFNNSVYKAYLDLATFGPIESKMYAYGPREYYSDKQLSSTRKDKKNIVLIVVLIIVFILIFYKFINLFVKEK